MRRLQHLLGDVLIVLGELGFVLPIVLAIMAVFYFAMFGSWLVTLWIVFCAFVMLAVAAVGYSVYYAVASLLRKGG